MTSSHRSSDRRARRRHGDDYRRSRSTERYRRSRRSRSDSRDRYRRRSASRSPTRSAYRNISSSSSSCRSRIRVDSPEPCRCLGVFGLSVYTTEPYLNDIFCRFGKLEKSIVIYDAKTRLSRGFGFVYYSAEHEATLARHHCNGLEIHGRRIRVDYSITEQPHAPTPGVYMGNRAESKSPSSRDRYHNERHGHRSRGSYSRSSYDSR